MMTTTTTRCCRVTCHFQSKGPKNACRKWEKMPVNVPQSVIGPQFEQKVNKERVLSL